MGAVLVRARDGSLQHDSPIIQVLAALALLLQLLSRVMPSLCCLNMVPVAALVLWVSFFSSKACAQIHGRGGTDRDRVSVEHRRSVLPVLFMMMVACCGRIWLPRGNLDRGFCTRCLSRNSLLELDVVCDTFFILEIPINFVRISHFAEI
eukprot:2908745-Rhodomonas_salina.2